MRTSIEAQQWRYGLPETAEREKSMPIGRVSVSADAARIAAFLASDDASYITGVSGGLLMDWPPTSACEPSGQGFRSPKDVPKM